VRPSKISVCQARESHRPPSDGDQEAVFEEFRQVGVSATKQEGTGLGLTLCRKFVGLQGGRICVKIQEGVGFTFTIPGRIGE
jgi:signal transduction histidine kinase